MKDRLEIVDPQNGCTGLSRECPPPTVKVEKLNGGLLLFGVLVGNNCQIALPAFGFLFVFIGIILTVIGFKHADIDDPLEYANREEIAKNLRILGPTCVVVGIAMLIFAAMLRYLAKKARDKQTRIGFYCPVHGDFYPLSPGVDPRKYSFPDISSTRWWNSLGCLHKNESSDPIVTEIPHCPHSISTSNRSSFDAQVNNSSVNLTKVIITPATESEDQRRNSDGNIFLNREASRSLSIPNDVVSFPSYGLSKSNPPTSPPSPVHPDYNEKRLSCPILPEIGTISFAKFEKYSHPSIIPVYKSELKLVQPLYCSTSPTLSHISMPSDDETKKRKSVSILLPSEKKSSERIHHLHVIQ